MVTHAALTDTSLAASFSRPAAVWLVWRVSVSEACDVSEIDMCVTVAVCVGLPAPAPACMCGVEGSRPQPRTQASALLKKKTESGEARAASNHKIKDKGRVIIASIPYRSTTPYVHICV